MTYTHTKFSGYYSHIEILEESGEKYVIKTVHIPLKLEVAEDLKERILLQREILTHHEVPISTMVDLQIVEAEDSYNLIIKEKFEGVDFVDVVNETNLELYTDKFLHDIFAPLLTSTKEQYLKAGIDPILRNFVYRPAEKQFCYVDFIPPKVYLNHHYSQEVPEIEGPFYDIRNICHYDRAGIIYLQYINFLRVFPDKRDFVLTKFEHFLDKIGEPGLKKYIQESPLYHVHASNDLIIFLEGLKDWRGINYLHLREAICIAAGMNHQVKEIKEEIFKLTTHERDVDSPDYGLLPKAKFEEAKQTIISALS